MDQSIRLASIKLVSFAGFLSIPTTIYGNLHIDVNALGYSITRVANLIHNSGNREPASAQLCAGGQSDITCYSIDH